MEERRDKTNKQKIGYPPWSYEEGGNGHLGVLTGLFGSVCFVLPNQSREEVDLGALLEKLLARRRIRWPHKTRPW